MEMRNSRAVVRLVACLCVVVLDGTAQAQTSISSRPVAPAAGAVRPAAINSDPIILTGNQSLTISDPDYVIRNNITLRDNSTLIIRDSTFTHQADYWMQFALRASDNARVIIERSTLRGPINWQMFDNASVQ